ncbi:unnamed protein product [Lactuca saligna]|uniref:Uncharacterized protein n=1 Tax=Lactuca saligna TaxID=75948 RepID=A0AA36EI79_LACSI|nr:unnamed protein product [Lactuca saligna]
MVTTSTPIQFIPNSQSLISIIPQPCIIVLLSTIIMVVSALGHRSKYATATDFIDRFFLLSASYLARSNPVDSSSAFQFIPSFQLIVRHSARKLMNSQLWNMCAGPLVSLPQIGSLMVYFPQAHNEQNVQYSLLYMFNTNNMRNEFEFQQITATLELAMSLRDGSINLSNSQNCQLSTRSNASILFPTTYVGSSVLPFPRDWLSGLNCYTNHINRNINM